MSARALGTALLSSVAVTWLLLWGTSLPLGVPGEWVWPRLPLTVETTVGTVAALFFGGVYIAFVLWGLRSIEARRPLRVLAQLGMLVAAAFGWLWVLQESAPAPADLRKDPYVLFYPRSSGYFWQARYEMTETREFLTRYEDLLAQRDYLHIGTHPPGLTLAYRGLISLCEASPALSRAVLATAPAKVRDELQSIAELSARGNVVVHRADQAALWLAALLTLAAAAATAAGVYVLVRRGADRSTAWTTAALWPLVPAIAVFHPKSDTLFPFVAVAAASLWFFACDRRSLLCALAAGAVLWLGMMLSLAFLTIGLLLAVMTAWEWWIRPPHEHTLEALGTEKPGRWRVGLLAAGAFGFLLPTVALGVIGEINLLNVWQWNLANHALFYEHNTRTWWRWLLVNPWELAFAVGIPLVWLAGVAGWRACLHRPERAALIGPQIAFASVWGLLWLSGKNMGEAARLWILLMPWILMSAGPAIQEILTRENSSNVPRRLLDWRNSGPIAGILAAQLIVCVLTVLRVDGFHFTELVETVAGTGE